MTLLIVDDQAPNRRLLRAQLEAEGHTVLEADDGVAALAVLERVPMDAVISDLLMPRMDGYQLCAQVRQHERLWATPFLVLTGTYNSPSDRKLAADVGADGYLTKPTAVPVLLAALAEARQKAAGHTRAPLAPANEAALLKQYNSVLVEKLEERNTALEQLNHTLRESEARYRLLADHTEDFVTLNDTEGHRLYVSPSYYRVTGWTPEEIQSTDWRVRVHPEDLPLVERTRAANLAGETTSIEHRVRCRDGGWIWVEARCKAIFGPDGRVTQMLVGSRDITVRKQAEEVLKHRAEELERFHRLSVGRELRMIELKQEVNELARLAGKPPPYETVAK